MQYKIKAINVNGESDYSEPLTVTVGVIPNAPINLAVRQIYSSTSLEITWDDGASISSNPSTLSFNVYLDDLSGNPPAKVFDSTSKAITNIATLKGLNPGDSYLVTLTSVNVIGESLPSSPLTIYAGTPPSKIEKLVWEESNTTSITVKWDAPSSNGSLSLLKYTLYIDEG